MLQKQAREKNCSFKFFDIFIQKIIGWARYSKQAVRKTSTKRSQITLKQFWNDLFQVSS